jgi:hypothetical protein
MDQERPAQHLDPYEKPPEKLKAIFKNLRGHFDQQKADKENFIDLKSTSLPALGRIPQDVLLDVLSKFHGHGVPSEHELTSPNFKAQGHVYCSNEIPGRVVSTIYELSIGDRYQMVVFSDALLYVSNGK